MVTSKDKDQPAAQPSGSTQDVVVQGQPLGDVTPPADGNRDIDQVGGKQGVDGDPNMAATPVDPDAINDPPELYSPTQGGPDRFGPGPHEDELPADQGVEPTSDKA